MGSDKPEGGSKYFVKQAILLVITIVLVAFCTIPLIQAVKWALNPEKLKANLDRANAAVADVETKLDVANSKILMGAGDDESQEATKKQVEELKKQKAKLLSEINDLRLPQMFLKSTTLSLWGWMPELVMKVFGFIGSLISMYTFVRNWSRSRRASSRRTSAG